jgi:hypothetical protein
LRAPERFTVVDCITHATPDILDPGPGTLKHVVNVFYNPVQPPSALPPAESPFPDLLPRAVLRKRVVIVFQRLKPRALNDSNGSTDLFVNTQVRASLNMMLNLLRHDHYTVVGLDQVLRDSPALLGVESDTSVWTLCNSLWQAYPHLSLIFCTLDQYRNHVGRELYDQEVYTPGSLM